MKLITSACSFGGHTTHPHIDGESWTVQLGKRLNLSESDIVNIATSSISHSSASFRKTTFINKICIYDEDMNVIAIAKVATPARKVEKNDFTFKLKIDI